MSARSAALKSEVLALPRDERAEIAAEVLASLDDESGDDPVGVERAWGDEMLRRSRGRRG